MTRCAATIAKRPKAAIQPTRISSRAGSFPTFRRYHFDDLQPLRASLRYVSVIRGAAPAALGGVSGGVGA
jgi:hypothetical protein